MIPHQKTLQNIFSFPFNAITTVTTKFSLKNFSFASDRSKILDLLTHIPKSQRESFARNASCLMLDEMTISDKKKIFETIMMIPKKNRESVTKNLGSIISDTMSVTDKIQLIHMVKNSSEEKIAYIAQQVNRLIIDNTLVKDEDKIRLISRLTSCPLHKLQLVATQQDRLISDTMSFKDKACIVGSLQFCWSYKMEGLITEAVRLISNAMSAKERIFILYNLQSLRTTNLEFLITQGLRLISDTMNAQERILLIRSLEPLRIQNLEFLTTQALRLISSTMSAQERISIVKTLDSLTLVDIDSVVHEVLSRLSENTSSEEIVRMILEESRNVDFREIDTLFSRMRLNKISKFSISSQELDENPIKVSVDLLDMLEKNSIKLLPSSIEFTDSSGIDSGGLTRTFVTKLIESFCNPKYCLVKETDLGAIPVISKDDNSSPLSLEDQAKCFSIIGRFFSGAMQKYKSLQIGRHFHPIVFEMIFNLNETDLLNKNSSEVLDKMLKIYMQKELNCEEHIVKNVLDNNITKKLRDLYCVNSKEEFIEDYEINKKINATLLIAKSMYDSLSDKKDWNRLKGDSVDILKTNIQGVLSKDAVINSFQYNHESILLEYITKWINETTPKSIENFVEAITGMTTLFTNHELNIIHSHGLDRLPIFHTCGFSIELSDYSSYDMFKEKLELSLAHCFGASGYQIG